MKLVNKFFFVIFFFVFSCAASEKSISLIRSKSEGDLGVRNFGGFIDSKNENLYNQINTDDKNFSQKYKKTKRFSLAVDKSQKKNFSSKGLNNSSRKLLNVLSFSDEKNDLLEKKLTIQKNLTKTAQNANKSAIKPIKQQKEKLEEKIKTLNKEVTVMKNEFEQEKNTYKSEITLLKKELLDIKQTEENCPFKNNALLLETFFEQHNQKLESNKFEYENKINMYKRKLNTFKATIDRLSQDKKSFEDELQRLKDLEKINNNEISKYKSEIENLFKEKKELELKIAASDKKFEMMKEELENITLSNEVLSEKANKLSEKENCLLKDKTILDNNILNLNQQIKNLEIQLKDLNKINSDNFENTTRLRKEKSELEIEKKEQLERIQTLLNQAHELNKKYNTLKDKYNNKRFENMQLLSNQVKKLEQEKANLLSKLETLKTNTLHTSHQYPDDERNPDHERRKNSHDGTSEIMNKTNEDQQDKELKQKEETIVELLKRIDSLNLTIQNTKKEYEQLNNQQVIEIDPQQESNPVKKIITEYRVPMYCKIFGTFVTLGALIATYCACVFYKDKKALEHEKNAIK